jgi:hypothetical protein
LSEKASFDRYDGLDGSGSKTDGMRKLRRRIRLFARRRDGMLVYEGKLPTADAVRDRNFQRLSLPNMPPASGKTLAHQEDGARDLNGLSGTSFARVFGQPGERPERRLQ